METFLNLSKRNFCYILKLNDIKIEDQTKLNVEKLKKEIIRIKKNEKLQLFSNTHFRKNSKFYFNREKMKNICIVAGEPNSINSEIIAKSWLKLKIADRKKLIIIGNYNLIKLQLKKLKYKIDLEKTNILNQTKKNKLRIYDISFKKNKLSKYIKDSLNKAHELAIKRKIKGFINCAIDKSNLPNQNGVTEYLSSKNKNNFLKICLSIMKRFQLYHLQLTLN